MRVIFLFIAIFFASQGSSLNVHIFGDSHSCEFSHTAFYKNFGTLFENPSKIPDCRVHWLGPITMHRIGRDGFSSRGCGVKEGDIVIFAFGEIDARCHINKQVDQCNRPLDTVIDTLASNYVQAILYNRSCYKDLICMIYSVTPPTDDRFNTPEYPQSGTVEDRVIATKQLNAKLAELCDQHNILFIDVYDQYALADGTLNLALSDGCVHISPKYNTPIWGTVKQLLTARYPDNIPIKDWLARSA